MKVFNINLRIFYSDRYCVVAETMGDAERLFKAEHPNIDILSITLHSDHVIVQCE